MDWNNDGKVDYKDYAIYDNEISNNSGSSGGGGGGGFGDGDGCLTTILVVLLIFVILKGIIEIFS